MSKKKEILDLYAQGYNKKQIKEMTGYSQPYVWKILRHLTNPEKFSVIDYTKYKTECVRCGVKGPPEIFDFHHIDPQTKVANVSDLIVQDAPQKKILAEIAKCEIICTNCHRIETSEDKNFFKSMWRKGSTFLNFKQRYVCDILDDSFCIDCGEDDIRVLEFHHEDQKNKNLEVSRLLGSNANIDLIIEEIDKCVVLCSNCHRHHHFAADCS